MALHFSSACFYALSQRKVQRIKAVASEDFVKFKAEEEELLKLGGSDLKVTKLGIGAWSWGDASYWNNFDWDDRKMKAAKNAFDTSIDCCITFFDIAEVYGSRASFGAISSETLLGRYIKERKENNPEVDVAVATKYAALPWRLGRQSVLTVLKDSLYRLGLSSVDLYQLHWPGILGNEGYIDGLGDAVEQGLVKAVGVSNYSEKHLRDSYERLKKRGIPLASNQVNYSLIYRLPEENGVKATCDELGITLIAYSPIAQGALTGKYTPENTPTGPHRNIYTREFLTKLQPLINRIKEIGQNHGKTPTQVALNWLIAQGNVVPIPGAKMQNRPESLQEHWDGTSAKMKLMSFALWLQRQNLLLVFLLRSCRVPKHLHIYTFTIYTSQVSVVIYTRNLYTWYICLPSVCLMNSIHPT